MSKLNFKSRQAKKKARNLKRIDRLEKRIAKQSARSGAVRFNTIKRLYNKKDLATSVYK
jgi:hypothetical protein